MCGVSGVHYKKREGRRKKKKGKRKGKKGGKGGKGREKRKVRILYSHTVTTTAPSVIATCRLIPTDNHVSFIEEGDDHSCQHST